MDEFNVSIERESLQIYQDANTVANLMSETDLTVYFIKALF